jgi:hypothetical protein
MWFEQNWFNVYGRGQTLPDVAQTWGVKTF